MYKTFSHHSCLVSVSTTSRYWFLNDTPVKNGQNILKQYINDAHDVLKSKIDLLTNFKKPFTKGEEVNLKMMLNILTDARRTWEEENHQ